MLSEELKKCQIGSVQRLTMLFPGAETAKTGGYNQIE
jgi:hypothetical protein